MVMVVDVVVVFVVVTSLVVVAVIVVVMWLALAQAVGRRRALLPCRKLVVP